MIPPRMFQLTIGTAHAGWMDFSVAFGMHRRDIEASGVLNDPLEELARVAAALLEPGDVHASVRFWCEPDWEILRFEDAASSGLVAVQMEPSCSGPRLLATLERKQVGADIAEALLAHCRRLPVSGKIDGWGVFPNSQVRRAVNALRPDPAPDITPPWTLASGNLQRVLDEVKAEVGTNHPLHGVELSLRAVRLDTDDYLFETGSAAYPLAVVRLTWRGSRGRSSRCPMTMLYSSWREWAEASMSPVR